MYAVLDYSSNIRCPSKKNIYEGRGNWLSVTILILAIYSTIFSGFWLMIAIAKPRYGQGIKLTGGLTPSTASLLCALFAKTIELSFVTVFVAFLGQVLSRRAFIKNSKGITIADMSLRSWIMQPGTMITHWESVRYAAWTFLGMIALTATFIAMLYTTASDALGACAVMTIPKLFRVSTQGRSDISATYAVISISFRIGHGQAVRILRRRSGVSLLL